MLCPPLALQKKPRKARKPRQRRKPKKPRLRTMKRKKNLPRKPKPNRQKLKPRTTMRTNRRRRRLRQKSNEDRNIMGYTYKIEEIDLNSAVLIAVGRGRIDLLADPNNKKAAAYMEQLGHKVLRPGP